MKFLYLILMVGCGGKIVIPEPEEGEDTEEAQCVCHVETNELVCDVDPYTVQEHLDHGDYLGECEE